MREGFKGSPGRSIRQICRWSNTQEGFRGSPGRSIRQICRWSNMREGFKGSPGRSIRQICRWSNTQEGFRGSPGRSIRQICRWSNTQEASQGSQQGMRTVSEMKDSYGYRKKGLPHLRERQTFLFQEKRFSLRISLMMKITGTDALLKTNLLQIPLLRMCKER